MGEQNTSWELKRQADSGTRMMMKKIEWDSLCFCIKWVPEQWFRKANIHYYTVLVGQESESLDVGSSWVGVAHEGQPKIKTNKS